MTGVATPSTPPTEVASAADTQEVPTVAAPATVTERPSPSPTFTPLPTPSQTAKPTATPTPTPLPIGQPASTISLLPIVSGFSRPTYLNNAGDLRLFIVEQAGRIWIVDEGEINPRPFLDIVEKVTSGALEQGLLSIAFHPDYQQNRIFFIYYTDLNGDTAVARYETSDGDPDLADLESEAVILTVDQPFLNHNGGQLQFGPGGYLYIGLGDGGSGGDPQNNGQNASTLLGSLLRISVEGVQTYVIPDDNPFAGVVGARPEIWAIGLRNPWRFSFDRATGDLFLADVGQNIWEEINYQPAGTPGGQNYGWHVLEGNNCYLQAGCDASGMTPPITEYSHQEGGCSVTGGYVYRGAKFPRLTGNYFFGDYCSGIIWSLFQEPDGSWVRNQVADTNLNISSFGEDALGELYVLDHASGVVYQIEG